jgi:pimeloyl-ACP methyl ester carboxylesterase
MRFLLKAVLFKALLFLALPCQTQTIVIGFVGGWVNAGDPRNTESKFITEMNTEHPDFDYAMFSNHDVESAYRLIRALDKGNAHIVLFGHSWGAAAVVDLARRLNKVNIPVDLTIQIDAIRKPIHRDGTTIPSNVRMAINFYQTRGLLHGAKYIHAANLTSTLILGNFERKYDQPVAWCCRNSGLFVSLFSRGHAKIECDPELWAEIRKLILN